MRSEFCKCGQKKEVRTQSYCRKCKASYIQKRRLEGREPLVGEVRQRHHARSMLKVYIKKGKRFKASYCSQCGSFENIEGHHEDYSKPLFVIWLCRKCHLSLHVNKRKLERELQNV